MTKYFQFEARMRRARAQRDQEMMAPPISPIVPFAPASPGPGNYASVQTHSFFRQLLVHNTLNNT